MSNHDNAYFLIPTVELTQAHISLSVDPFIARADVPIKTVNSVVYAIIEVPKEHIRHDAFVNYKPYRLSALSGLTSVDNLLGSRADFIGLFNIAQTDQGAQSYTYTFAAGRELRALAIDVLSFERGDTVSLSVQAPDGQGGWLTANTPQTNWYLQSGYKRMELAKRIVPVGFRINLTLNKLSTNVATTAMTVNLEQYKVGA